MSGRLIVTILFLGMFVFSCISFMGKKDSQPEYINYDEAIEIVVPVETFAMDEIEIISLAKNITVVDMEELEISISPKALKSKVAEFKKDPSIKG